MKQEKLNTKVLDQLHAAYLTHQYEEIKERRRVWIGGQTNADLAKMLGVRLDEIDRIAEGLQSDALINVKPHDNIKMLSLSGLGIKRLDFKENLEQMKSTMFIQMVATIMETNLKGIDPKDEKTWKNKIWETAGNLATSAFNTAVQATTQGFIKQVI